MILWKSLTERIANERKLFVTPAGRGVFLHVSICIGILFILFVYRLFDSTNYILVNLSFALWGVCLVLLGFGIMRYARLKGRSEFWGLLGYVGLIVIFFLKKKPGLAPLSSIQKMSLGDWILVGLLVFCMYPYAVYGAFASQGSYIPGSMEWSILSSDFFGTSESPKLWILSLPFLILSSTYLLIRNKRRVLPLAGWVFISLSFVLLFYQGQNYPLNFSGNSKGSMEVFQGSRNMFYLFLIIYAGLHLVIHLIAFAFNRKRKIITAWGIYEWFCQIIAITFGYALVELALRVSEVLG